MSDERGSNRHSAMKKYFLSALLFLIFSCDDSGRNVPSVFGNEHLEFFSELHAENERAKDTMIREFNSFIHRSLENDLKTEAEALLSSITEPASFIDSLRQRMKQINGSDAENLYTINKLIGDGPLGDTLNFHVEKSLVQARKIVLLDDQKKSIDSIRFNLMNSSRQGIRWQTELFGKTNPVGATLILYGLENELYSLGIISFR